MRKGLTEIVFILDRSGSMSGLEADTIGGFNSMLKKQQRAGQQDRENFQSGFSGTSIRSELMRAA